MNPEMCWDLLICLFGAFAALTVFACVVVLYQIFMLRYGRYWFPKRKR